MEHRSLVVLACVVVALGLGASCGDDTEHLRPGQWQSLFDGKTLRGWRVVEEGEFARRGRVRVVDGHIILERGHDQTGVAWAEKFPRLDYEVEFEARRDSGPEFCKAVFPVGTSLCGLTIGGWGATIIGLSTIDGRKANVNETTKTVHFGRAQWYRVRLRVTKTAIQAWLDGKEVIRLATAGRRLEGGRTTPAGPFGIVSFQATVRLRNVRLRRLARPGSPLSGQARG